MKKLAIVGMLLAISLVGCNKESKDVKENGIGPDATAVVDIEDSKEENKEEHKDEQNIKEEYTLVNEFGGIENIYKAFDGLLYEKNGNYKCFMVDTEGEEIEVDIVINVENNVEVANLYNYEGIVNTQELDKVINRNKDKVGEKFIVILNGNTLAVY